MTREELTEDYGFEMTEAYFLMTQAGGFASTGSEPILTSSFARWECGSDGT